MSLAVKFFSAGYCTHPEAMVIRGGDWKTTQFPALFALILHPTHGAILFDTGYSDRFFQQTRSFPFRLYALTTPVSFQPQDSAAHQLQQIGISPTEIQYILISHFHADHIGGLRDFPNAQFFCFQSAYQAVKDRQGISALQAGFLAGLLPPDFAQRVRFVEDEVTVCLPSHYAPFDRGVDVLGDGTLLAVELPGHATGQMGLFFTAANHQPYFLIADACWLSRAYQELVHPHPLAQLIFADRPAYTNTLTKIHQLHHNNPDLKIIPTHCTKTWNELQQLA